MLNWMRKKRPAPPVEAIAATPCTELVDHLFGQLPEGVAGELPERVERFRRSARTSRSASFPRPISSSSSTWPRLPGRGSAGPSCAVWW